MVNVGFRVPSTSLCPKGDILRRQFPKTGLHAPTVLTTDLEQGVRDVAQ